MPTNYYNIVAVQKILKQRRLTLALDKKKVCHKF